MARLTANPVFNPLYAGFYLAGLPYHRVRFEPLDVTVHDGCAVVLAAGGPPLRLYLSADDHPDIHADALAWCDAYGKVNLDRARVPAVGGEKIVALGPGFAVRPWSRPGTLAFGARAVWAGRHSLGREGRRDTLGRYRSLARNRSTIGAYRPSTSDPTYVYFAARLWDSIAGEVDASRERFVESCRRRSDITFEGGFVSDGQPRVGLDAYLERLGRSAIAFNTPAVHECLGWKLGEFLALGKAIITTPISRELPAPLEPGHHVHVVDGSAASIDDAIDRLLHDQPYRATLERNARAYFDAYVTPTRAIARVVERARAMA